MKILKLLNNKKYLLVSFSFFFILTLKIYSAEPVDIWNIEKKETGTELKVRKNSSEENIPSNLIYKMQSQESYSSKIEEDETLLSKKIEIAGLYDPSENGLTIDMWINSDGKQIVNLFNKIEKIELSNDAKEILNISLLTNSYFPNQDITSEQFLKLKTDWLIKNGDLKLIENYLIKNKNINKNPKLIKYLLDEYLSKSEIENSCNIFSKIINLSKDDYLSKFQIYCLINENKKEEAQLQYDLKKELGFVDELFEKRFNYLIGYETEINQKISQKSILDFHLSHRTNPDFKFEPNELTPQHIWKYLSTSNLLDAIESVDLEDLNKISIIEKATHEKNYTEKELYDLYKRFQFNINQLLNAKQSYKVLSNVEARALVYQGILITSEAEKRLELIKILKDLFTKEGIQNAFHDELVRVLKEINVEDVPSNYTNFYNTHVNDEKTNLTKIKINNKIIHQSKLLNYFRVGMPKKNIEKDTNDLLKKIKKDKKYFVSTKDIILLESLKSDEIRVLKKYDDFYEIDESNMPSDIQTYIDNDEIGLVLLRIVQVIGQDDLENIGSETIYFIINALNQLNIDRLRNKILLKVLPLKV